MNRRDFCNVGLALLAAPAINATIIPQKPPKAVWYASASGTTQNPGNTADAPTTVQEAINRASPGDTVRLLDPFVYGTVEIDKPAENPKDLDESDIYLDGFAIYEFPEGDPRVSSRLPCTYDWKS